MCRSDTQHFSIELAFGIFWSDVLFHEQSNNLAHLAWKHHGAPRSEELCSSIFRQQSVHLTEFRRILMLVDLPDQGLGGAGAGRGSMGRVC